VTLDELLEEVGPDVARYFFLLRKADSHLDFDLDVAKKQSMDNPVYYVQYAHARISSIYEQGKVRGQVEAADHAEGRWRGKADLSLMGPHETELVRRVRLFPRVIEGAARLLDPALVPTYLQSLAESFQSYYQKGDRDKTLRVLTEDEPVRRMRLAVVASVQQTLRNGLAVLGVSAPNHM
jgi:arginyl-tRNA synthetase